MRANKDTTTPPLFVDTFCGIRAQGQGREQQRHGGHHVQNYHCASCDDFDPPLYAFQRRHGITYNDNPLGCPALPTLWSIHPLTLVLALDEGCGTGLIRGNLSTARRDAHNRQRTPVDAHEKVRGGFLIVPPSSHSSGPVRKWSSAVTGEASIDISICFL